MRHVSSGSLAPAVHNIKQLRGQPLASGKGKAMPEGRVSPAFRVTAFLVQAG